MGIAFIYGPVPVAIEMEILYNQAPIEALNKVVLAMLLGRMGDMRLSLLSAEYLAFSATPCGMGSGLIGQGGEI